MDHGFTQDDAGAGGLEGGVVDTTRHLVTLGVAGPDVDTWGTIEGIVELTSDEPTESTYYRAGCVPLSTALGPDADIEDQEAVVDEHDPTDLLPFAVCNEVEPMDEPTGLCSL